MTLVELLNEGTQKIGAKQIPYEDLEAWYLFTHVFKMKRSDFFLHQETEAEEKEEREYKRLVKLRCDHIPLQYITGEQEFMGYTFQVNEHVLIPRQDTEILTEEVQKILKPGMSVLDLCTGSGCILLSLMKNCKEIAGTGADISGEAVKIANENKERLQVPEAVFIESDLFDSVHGKFHIIVSNPPYISTAEIENLMAEVKEYEPHIALDGGKDGLDFYKKIVYESKKHLKKEGWLYLEIGCEQASDVVAMLREEKFQNINIINDYAGWNRVVYAQHR